MDLTDMCMQWPARPQVFHLERGQTKINEHLFAQSNKLPHYTCRQNTINQTDTNISHISKTLKKCTHMHSIALQHSYTTTSHKRYISSKYLSVSLPRQRVKTLLIITLKREKPHKNEGVLNNHSNTAKQFTRLCRKR